MNMMIEFCITDCVTHRLMCFYAIFADFGLHKGNCGLFSMIQMMAYGAI